MDTLTEKIKILIEQYKGEIETKVTNVSKSTQPNKTEENKTETNKTEENKTEENKTEPNKTEENEYDNNNDFNSSNNNDDFNSSADNNMTGSDIGRVYEIKQIHFRLIAIRNHLEIFVEKEFDDVKKILTKAITLFELVVNNYNKYEDKIDDIIILYYTFIKDIYDITKKKYKKYTKQNLKK